MWWLVSSAWAMDLSYDDALKRALEKNPVLLEAEQDLKSAEGSLLGSKGIFDPTLTANAQYGRNADEYLDPIARLGTVTTSGPSYGFGLYEYFATGTSAALRWDGSYGLTSYDFAGDENDTTDPFKAFQSTFSATLEQSLLQGIVTRYNLAPVRAARQYRDLQDARVGEQREQTLADTANAYWLLYYREKVAEISAAALSVAQEEQRVVRARVEAGDLAPVERSRVDALVVQAEAALLTARNDALEANDALLLQLGEQPGQTVSLTTEPTDPPSVELQEDRVVEEALVSSPAMQASRIAEETAKLEFRDARHAELPELTGKAGYLVKGYESGSLADATREALGRDYAEWYVGAELSVPLLNRADRGEAQNKEAIVAKTRIDRESLERGIDMSVRAQVRILASSRKSVALAEANLSFAEETLAAQRALQNAGRAIQKDVLEAIRDADDAKVQLAKARADTALAIVELNRLKGTL